VRQKTIAQAKAALEKSLFILHPTLQVRPAARCGVVPRRR
jgi:hypothetical protein